MSPDEINERAWKQMRAMHDYEIISHEAAIQYCLDYPNTDADIWDLRIAVRDYFFNELWREMKGLR